MNKEKLKDLGVILISLATMIINSFGFLRDESSFRWLYLFAVVVCLFFLVSKFFGGKR